MTDAILGAIVGALSAIVGSIISGVLAQIVKQRTDERRENRRRLSEGCEEAKKLLFKIVTSGVHVDDERARDLQELIMNVKTKLTIYASRELSNTFDGILGKIDERDDYIDSDEYRADISAFNGLIKKELNIKK